MTAAEALGPVESGRTGGRLLSWTRQAGLPWRAMEVGWRRTSLASLGRLAEKALESCGTGRRQSSLA